MLASLPLPMSPDARFQTLEYMERLVNLLKRDEPPGVHEADEDDEQSAQDDEIAEV